MRIMIQHSDEGVDIYIIYIYKLFAYKMKIDFLITVINSYGNVEDDTYIPIFTC